MPSLIRVFSALVLPVRLLLFRSMKIALNQVSYTTANTDMDRGKNRKAVASAFDHANPNEKNARPSRLLQLPPEIRLIIYEMICRHGMIKVRGQLADDCPYTDIYRQPRLEGSALLHICQQMRREALSIFYKLTTFDLGSLFGEVIRARLDTATRNYIQLIKLNVPQFHHMLQLRWLDENVAPCRRGVVMPCVKRVCAVVEWRDFGTEVLVDFIMTIRVISVGKCDRLDIEETGYLAARAA